MSFQIVIGNALDVLRTLPDESVNCCVTSPPYWGLRDYKLVPQIWGGYSSCEHRWNLESVERENRTGLGLKDSPVSTRGGGHKIAEVGWQRFERGFCSSCGAWLGSLGLEATPELYVEHIVQVFQEVRRVLRKDGTCWINLGDSYASKPFYDGDTIDPKWKQARNRGRNNGPNRRALDGLKPKDLIGIPWRVAFALQADGWYLRSDIIWSKLNPMPESVTDRPTKAHEYIFLLSKSARYFYDAESIKEPASLDTADRYLRAHSGYEPPGQTSHHGPAVGPRPNQKRPSGWNDGPTEEDLIGRYPSRDNFQRTTKEAENLNGGGLKQHRLEREPTSATGRRNKRSVWTISTSPTPEAHFATYPIDLVEPCILAGCPKEGIVLDPFSGAGTTGLACLKHGLNFFGVELNPEFVEIAHSRARKFYPLFFAAQKKEPGTVPGFDYVSPTLPQAEGRYALKGINLKDHI